MRRYQNTWGLQTEVYWVKAHAEEGDKLTDCHKKENKRADENAEVAYEHPDTPENREGYVSQLISMYGQTIEGKVVAHKMGATVLRHLQFSQYLRYWKARAGAGAWAYNADIGGHTAAYRRAQKANANTVSSGACKEMSGRRLTRDLEHQRDHRYDPSELVTAESWPAETIDTWIRTEDGEVTDTLSQLLGHKGVRSVSEVPTKRETSTHRLHPPWLVR